MSQFAPWAEFFGSTGNQLYFRQHSDKFAYPLGINLIVCLMTH
jgi:hypothetical protein